MYCGGVPEPKKGSIRAFRTSDAFNRWLADNHDTATELYLRIYKKASKKPTVTWAEAVVEALCWGWIDSVKKSYDDVSYLQRFTPRRARSNWSKINRQTVERLLKEGDRMQEAGMVHVRAAQKDGRWEAAYAPPSEMTVPEDFVAAVKKNKAAWTFYQTLNKTNLYAIGYQLTTAKKPETRKRRFEKFLEMIKRQEKLH